MLNKYSMSLMLKGISFKAFGLLFVILICSSLVAKEKPSKEERKLHKKAKKELAKQKYPEAKANYKKLVDINPTNDVYNFEAGLSFYFSDFERTKSVPYFEAALKNSKEDTIPELLYYLGRAYHLNGDYKKSKNTLNEFIPFIKNHKQGQILLQETEKRISLNENGIEFKNNKDNNLKVKNLGSSINTSDREYAPVYRKKDQVILFTSRRLVGKGKKAHDLLPYEDIYAAKRVDENSWSMITDKNELGKYLPSNFNTKKHDAGVIYSIDGNTLYTYKKDKLWKSVYKDNKWSELEKLNDNINESQFNVPSISVTQDGKIMFFVATKKDGIGGKDIYKSVKNENGEWSDPEILSTEINTEYDEDGPFLSKDGKTLYFSSKGHKGIGGYDIYKSDFNNGNPTNPVNMGIPFNSPVDDIYLVIEDNNEIGFFSSDRDGGFGGMDIFGFDLSCPNINNTEIRGIVYNKTEKLPLEGKISLIEDGNTIDSKNSLASNGKFLLIAPPEKMYELVIEVPGYQKQTLSIQIPKQCEYYPLFFELAIEKSTADNTTTQTLTARNSFFNSSNVLANNNVDTSAIGNEVPLINTNGDKDFNNDKSLIAFTRSIDTANTDLAYNIITNSINYEKPVVDTSAIEYKQLFAYNGTDISIQSTEFNSFVTKAINKVQSYGKIEIFIESSASKVPTTTYKTNINLTSIRGDKAKEVLVKALTDKGISEDKITFKAINSVISGPKYSGDYNNTDKYSKFQYVKISVK